MKKSTLISVYIILLFVIASFFIGCEILDEPFKKKNAAIQSNRKVLIEDYTSHECTNCPTAAMALDDIFSLYSDNVIVIGVHSGSLSKLLIPPCTYNFTTSTGDNWCSYFKVEDFGFPNGLINRKERGGNIIIPHNNWATVVEEELAKPADAEIALEVSFDSISEEVQVKFSTNIGSPKQGEEYFITIVLTEDSIIKPQKNNNPLAGATPVIMDYNHMHILRMNITDDWGLKINPAIIDSRIIKKCFPQGNDFNPSNCNIVAFISDTSKEVLQAEQKKLISR